MKDTKNKINKYEKRLNKSYKADKVILCWSITTIETKHKIKTTLEGFQTIDWSK